MSDKVKGVVTQIFHSKGFGFCRTLGPEKITHFCHVRQFQPQADFERTEEGSILLFTSEESGQGQTGKRAFNIELKPTSEEQRLKEKRKLKQDTKKEIPFIWVTWLADFILAEGCQWKHWYRTHFFHAEKEKEISPWETLHNDRVQALLSNLVKAQTETTTIRVEKENEFRLTARLAIISGQPDIVTINEQDESIHVILVVGSKNTARSKLICAILTEVLPRVWKSRWTLTVGAYLPSGKILQVTDSDLDNGQSPTYREQIKKGIIQLTDSEVIPVRKPSLEECTHCRILNCEDRIEFDEGQTDVY